MRDEETKLVIRVCARMKAPVTTDMCQGVTPLCNGLSHEGIRMSGLPPCNQGPRTGWTTCWAAPIQIPN